MFGGIIFGLTGYLIGRFWFRFRSNPLDTVAVVLPLGASIQSVGCFFAGCCFGNPSDFPWAVRYPVNTLPHYNQFENGLIAILTFIPFLFIRSSFMKYLEVFLQFSW